MTGIAFKIAEGVECRACGGVLAPEHNNDYGLCQNCWASVSLFVGARFDKRSNRNHGRPVGDGDVTAWLANKLQRDVSRFDKTGMAGRCEAISGWTYGMPGTQCAKSATTWRDGHQVCSRHAKATSPQYVGTETADPYVRFADLLREICAKDAKFAAMLRDLIASVAA